MKDETPLGAISFAAFDLETTGMDPIRDRILEVGVVIFQGEEVKETLQHLINPEIPIPKEVQLIHGIADEMVAGKPRMGEILPDLLTFLSPHVPVAHNASFDLSFLLAAASERGIPFSSMPVVDSCLLARHVFPEFTTYRLESLAKKLGIKREQSHRALSDAMNCFSLFCRAIDRLPRRWETTWGEFRTSFPGVFSVDFEALALPEKFQPLEKAVRERSRLLLSYRDGQGEVTKRGVTPMGFVKEEGDRVLLVCYCHLRQGTRTFRLDRILDIEMVTS